jgi:hypothetical protein
MIVWWIAGGLVLLGLLLVAAWRVGRRHAPGLREARALFRMQREHLEAQFIQLAAASGKPRGLRWKACEWDDAVEFARERSTGRLAALVGLTIQFEAVAGSDMEGLPAVGNLRHASGVFFFHAGRWHTTGKALFNLNPEEVLRHLAGQYERLDLEANHRA